MNMNWIRGRFSRPGKREWEKPFLIGLFRSLGDPYERYGNHVEDGAIVASKLKIEDGCMRLSFGYGRAVNAYYKPEIKSELLRGIRVLDHTSLNSVEVELLLSGGLLLRCDFLSVNAVDLDPTSIDTSNFRSEAFGEASSHIDRLTHEDCEHLDANDLYDVDVEGQMILHLFDLEDGDFVGIDAMKTVVLVTHDPLEIKPLGGSVLEAIGSRKNF